MVAVTLCKEIELPNDHIRKRLHAKYPFTTPPLAIVKGTEVLYCLPEQILSGVHIDHDCITHKCGLQETKKGRVTTLHNGDIYIVRPFFNWHLSLPGQVPYAKKINKHSNPEDWFPMSHVFE
jgi:hypothetical protein